MEHEDPVHSAYIPPSEREQTLGEEIANAVSHGIGAILATACLVVAVVFASIGPRPDPWTIVSVSVYGTWHMMQLCFPYLKEKGGSIINFGSMGGVLGMEGFASYAAEKEAIRGLSRVVAREWGQYGIRVNCVCPNVVTDRVEEGLEFSPPAMKEFLVSSMSDNAMKRMGYAYAEFTPAMVFLASDDSLWITGQTLPVDGGAHRGTGRAPPRQPGRDTRPPPPVKRGRKAKKG